MKRFYKFLFTAKIYGWDFVKLSVLMLVIKIGLDILSFQRFYRFLTKYTPPASQKYSRPDEMLKILEMIEISSRYTPFRATCLIKAMSGQMLLMRKGFSTEMRIGVSRSSSDLIEAHAWVVYQGKIIIGDRDDLDRYAVLPGLMQKLQ
jgi:hypothetical protein